MIKWLMKNDTSLSQSQRLEKGLFTVAWPNLVSLSLSLPLSFPLSQAPCGFAAFIARSNCLKTAKLRRLYSLLLSSNKVLIALCPQKTGTKMTMHFFHFAILQLLSARTCNIIWLSTIADNQIMLHVVVFIPCSMVDLVTRVTRLTFEQGIKTTQNKANKKGYSPLVSNHFRPSFDWHLVPRFVLF